MEDKEYREKLVYSRMILEKLEEIKEIIGQCAYCPFESECYAKYGDEDKCLINTKISMAEDDVEFYGKRVKSIL